jgi:peptide/nickel transport system substrate-binding protein
VPIGTGPFIYKEWSRDNRFVADKNPNYWRKGLPYLDQIEFRPIPDTTARYNSLKSGDINLMVTSAEPTILKLLDDGKTGDVQVTRSTGNNDVTLNLINVTKAPMDDLRVRQAMAYSLNKKTLDDISSTDPALEADTVYQKESKWYTPAVNYPSFDLDKAKALVAAYTADKGPLEFSLTSTTDPDTLRSVQAEATMFQAAGMKVQVNTVDQATLIGNAVTGNFQAQIWRQFGGADPDLNYVWWIGSNATGALTLNMARNQDQQTDDALNAGRATNDFETRKAAYAKVQQRQTDLLPYLWLSHLRWTLGADNKVRGLQGMPLPDGGMSSGLVGGVVPVTAMWLDT